MSRITQTLTQNGSISIPQYAEDIQFILRGARGGTAGPSYDTDGRGALPCSPTYYGSYGHYLTGTLSNSLAQTTLTVVLGQPGTYNACSAGYDAGSAGGYGLHYGGSGGAQPGNETWCAAGGGAGGGGSSGIIYFTTVIAEAAGGGGAGGGVVDWSFLDQSGGKGFQLTTNNNGSNGGTGGNGNTSANAAGGGGGGGNPGGAGGAGSGSGNHIPGEGGKRGTSYYNTSYVDSASLSIPPSQQSFGSCEISYVINIPIPAPTVSLTSDDADNTVVAGTNIGLTYSATDVGLGVGDSTSFTATDAFGTVSNPIASPVGSSGVYFPSPVTTTTYTYTATNISGTATTSLTITVILEAPTVSILSSDGDNRINLGQCVNLSYSTTGYFITSSSLTSIANPGSSGVVQVCPTTTTTYTFTSTNSAGSGSASVTITVVQIPVVSLTSNDADNAIIQGQSVNLTWYTGSDFITSTSLSNYGPTPGTSGTASFSPQSTTLYTYTATNSAGSTTTGLTITVYIPPQVSISSNYSTLIIGECATLSWVGIASNVISSSLTGYNGSPGTSGSTTVCPTSTTTYTYTVTNLGGTDTDSVTIIVYVPPTITFTSNDSDNAILVGQSVILSWSVSGSTLTYTSLTSSVGDNSTPSPTGSLTVTPTITTTYTYTAVNLGGTDIKSITIVVYQVPQLTVTQPSSIDYGESLSIPLTYRYASGGVSVSETYTYRDPATGGFVSNTDVYQVLTGNGDDQFAAEIVTNFIPNITWNDQGPFAIQYSFTANGSGGQEIESITVGVDLDLMPLSVNAPSSIDQLPGAEVLSPDDETIISDPMMIENIDIPVEVKATKPIQVRFDDQDTWHDLRKSDL